MRSTTKEAAPYSFASSILSERGNKEESGLNVVDPKKKNWGREGRKMRTRRNMVGRK